MGVYNETAYEISPMKLVSKSQLMCFSNKVVIWEHYQICHLATYNRWKKIVRRLVNGNKSGSKDCSGKSLRTKNDNMLPSPNQNVWLNTNPERYSEPFQASKTEHFTKIVNG